MKLDKVLIRFSAVYFIVQTLIVVGAWLYYKNALDRHLNTTYNKVSETYKNVISSYRLIADTIKRDISSNKVVYEAIVRASQAEEPELSKL